MNRKDAKTLRNFLLRKEITFAPLRLGGSERIGGNGKE
jgi:hypothetical protein